jgi:hypothetical protein
MKLEWGDVPAWIGSVLTGSSFLIASLTYRRSVRDRREEELNREREQAAKVSAWVANSSSGVYVYLQNAGYAAAKARVFFEDPSSAPILAYDEVAIGPDQRLVTDSPIHSSYAQELREWPATPALLIVDSAGATWLRHPNGKLDRISEQDTDSLEKKLNSHRMSGSWH